jgi:hypothetical protein
LNGGKHLKVLAKNKLENGLETKAKTTTRPKRQSIAMEQTIEFILREAPDGCR